MTDYGFDGPLLNPGHYDDDSSTGLCIEALLDGDYAHVADDRRKQAKEDEPISPALIPHTNQPTHDRPHETKATP